MNVPMCSPVDYGSQNSNFSDDALVSHRHLQQQPQLQYHMQSDFIMLDKGPTLLHLVLHKLPRALQQTRVIERELGRVPMM